MNGPKNHRFGWRNEQDAPVDPVYFTRVKKLHSRQFIHSKHIQTCGSLRTHMYHRRNLASNESKSMNESETLWTRKEVTEITRQIFSSPISYTVILFGHWSGNFISQYQTRNGIALILLAIICCTRQRAALNWLIIAKEVVDCGGGGDSQYRLST